MVLAAMLPEEIQPGRVLDLTASAIPEPLQMQPTTVAILMCRLTVYQF
jgi:hypothetical protein